MKILTFSITFLTFFLKSVSRVLLLGIKMSKRYRASNSRDLISLIHSNDSTSFIGFGMSYNLVDSFLSYTINQLHVCHWRIRELFLSDLTLLPGRILVFILWSNAHPIIDWLDSQDFIQLLTSASAKSWPILYNKVSLIVPTSKLFGQMLENNSKKN